MALLDGSAPADGDAGVGLRLHALLRVAARADDETEEVVPGVLGDGDDDLALLLGGAVVGGRAERGAHLDDGLDELGATRGVALAVEALAGVEALAVAVVHGLGRGGTVAFGAIVEGKAGQRAAVGLGELAKRRASLGGGVGRRGVLAQERARELHAEAAGELERARGNECGRRRGRGRQRIRTREREARRLRGLARLPPRLAPALGLGADFGRGVGRDLGRRRLGRGLGRWTPTPATTLAPVLDRWVRRLHRGRTRAPGGVGGGREGGNPRDPIDRLCEPPQPAKLVVGRVDELGRAGRTPRGASRPPRRRAKVLPVRRRTSQTSRATRALVAQRRDRLVVASCGLVVRG